MAVTVCMAVLATSAMAAGTNLLSNGDFEGSGSGSLTGWKGQSATLALVAGDNGAGFGAQVTRSGTTGTYSIKWSADVVTNAGAGDVYTSDGRFKAPVGKNVCFKVKESGTTSKTVTGCTVGTGGWATLAELNYTVVSSGDVLDFFVEQKSAVANDSFTVDNLSFSTTGTTIAPPTNLQATGTSPTEIDLTWNASTTPTVTGYHVFKDDGSQPFATVNAPSHAFEDLTVLPATTHHYMVTAFDANGESIASNEATATTPSQGGGGGLDDRRGRRHRMRLEHAHVDEVPSAGDREPDPLAPFPARLGVHARRQPVPLRRDRELQRLLRQGVGRLPEQDPPDGRRPGHRRVVVVRRQAARTATSSTSERGPSRTGRVATTTSICSDGNGANWRVIDLNGNCPTTSCAVGSPQELFLKNAINTTPSGSCIMAMWHQPFFSGSSLNGHSAYKPFWDDLYAAHAALVLNGHAHYYERYKPQNPSGAVDPGQRHHRDDRRHRRDQPRLGEGHLAQHRRLQQPELGRDLPHVELRFRRLAVRERGRPDGGQRHALLHAPALAARSRLPGG